MDPDACAAAYFEAVANSQWPEAFDCIGDLKEWRRSEGFDTPAAQRARKSWAHLLPLLVEAGERYQ